MTEEKKRARKSYENQNWNRWGTPRGRSTDPVQGTDVTDFGCAEGGERSDQHLAEIRLLQRKYRVLPDLGWNPVLWNRQWWDQCTYERQHLPDKIQTLRAWGTSSGKFYADIEICNREYQPHLFNQPEPDGIKCGGICRHTQAGVCLKILLQTINQ